MAVEITHVRFASTPRTEATISSYRWRNPSDATTGESSKAVMVAWIDDQSGKAYVGSGTDQVQVGTVHPGHGAPYLRTYADGKWTNNLLSLPEF